MSFPAPAAHGQGQIKESGGQPLVYGSIPVDSLLQRFSGASSHVVRGLGVGSGLLVVGTNLTAPVSLSEHHVSLTLVETSVTF